MAGGGGEGCPHSRWHMAWELKETCTSWIERKRNAVDRLSLDAMGSW